MNGLDIRDNQEFGYLGKKLGERNFNAYAQRSVLGMAWLGRYYMASLISALKLVNTDPASLTSGCIRSGIRFKA